MGMTTEQKSLEIVRAIARACQLGSADFACGFGYAWGGNSLRLYSGSGNVSTSAGLPEGSFEDLVDDLYREITSIGSVIR